MNIQWFPGHMAKTRRMIADNIRLCDCVAEIVDARCPQSSRNPELPSLSRGKNSFIIINKCDLADPAQTERWQRRFASEGLVSVCTSSNDGKGVGKITDAAMSAMAEQLEKNRAKGLVKPPRIMVCGIPNVGKSTLINKMVGKKVANVGNTPGITKNLVALKTNYNITLVDTPGILWPKIKDREVALNLASFSSIKLEVLDINEIAVHIIQKLVKCYPQKLIERYKIEVNLKDLEVLEIYEVIAKAIGAFKNQEVDYEKVSLRIINDLKNEYIKGVCFD